MFYSEKDDAQVKNIQDSSHSTQGWASQHIHPNIRLYNIQKNKETSYIQTLHVKVHENIIWGRLNKYG